MKSLRRASGSVFDLLRRDRKRESVNLSTTDFDHSKNPSQNGSNSSNADSLLVEIERLKTVIIDKDKEIEKIKQKHNEDLKSREETIRRMQDIIDKSVGGIITLNRQQSRDGQNSNSKEGEKGPPVTKFLERPKKQRTGISAEPFNDRVIVNTDPKVKKPVHTKAFLLGIAALKSNDFVKSLENEQLDQIVNCMQKKTYDPKTDIIVEGSVGERLYVLAAGKVQVLQNERSDTGGIVLGELALLYNCRRTATVRALTTCTLWFIDRSTFRQIMVYHNQTQREMHKLFLRKVSLLRTYSDRKINKLVDAMTVEEFQDNDVITREGSYGDVFYIILEGQVEVTKKQVGFIRSLSGGEYFGEKALLNEASIRTATCTAIGLVRCLTLDRDAFVTLIGTTAERNYDDDHKLSISSNSSAECLTPLTPTGAMMIQSLPSFSDVRLTDLKQLGTLGVGGFGRVELVKCLRALPNKGTKLPSSFALKVMRKEHIVETSQEKHIFNERDILFTIDTKWVVKLYRTFRDRSFIYMLIEPCLGGELWTVLRNKGSFPEKWARFYTACCVEGLAYLHSKHIIYRDLKPENLVLDSRGFPKLCDFGFAKKIKPGHKAWTFCGTPEYVPPEIILNKGHDFSADFYALGIFIFELLTGNPPYNSADAMKVYRMALKGLESFPFPVDKISRSASQIIRLLAKEFPSERLGNGRNGIQDIKRNKWFTGFDWESLSSQTMDPPYIPSVSSATDLTNFDQFDEPEDDFMAADNAEESGWDKEF
ncbi:unnamed protein product [Oikopleura dioica]|uniref:cGMP-dependent protein kinase n=1 Tax=Oikopleura dioica TaxID=34765 RepID=E4WSM4_OIKDI|nr:unnamed protein product [Oikopleura dioica]